MAENEGTDKYLLTGRGEILEKLRWLERAKTIMSGQIANSGTTFITTIVKILPDKNILAIDVSAQDTTNRRVSRAEYVVFRSDYEGIANQFTGRSIKDATLEDAPVFSVAIPEQILWVQRRAFFRVPVPFTMPAHCRFRFDGGDELEFHIIDISLNGLAFWDRLSFLPKGIEEGYILPEVSLELPSIGIVSVALEVRNKVNYSEQSGGKGQRFGCKFVEVSKPVEIQLQKFLFELQILQREKNRLLKG